MNSSLLAQVSEFRVKVTTTQEHYRSQLAEANMDMKRMRETEMLLNDRIESLTMEKISLIAQTSDLSNQIAGMVEVGYLQ
jgi:hypothetical protein